MCKIRERTQKRDERERGGKRDVGKGIGVEIGRSGMKL